jgi:hypothetical protein
MKIIFIINQNLFIDLQQILSPIQETKKLIHFVVK